MSRSPGDQEDIARRGRAFAVVAVVGALAFAGLAGREGTTIGWVRDVVLYNVPFTAGAGAALWRTHKALNSPARVRLAWGLLAVALAVHVLGNLYYTLVDAHLQQSPDLSWADVGHVPFYPLVYVALILMLRSRVAQWYRSVWLDGVIAALVLIALGVQFALDAVMREAPGHASVAGVAVDLAFPIGDLSLLAVLVGSVALLRFRVDRSWALLAAGLVGQAVANATFAVLEATGRYVEGTVLDLVYVAGAVCLTFAAVVDAGRPVRPRLAVDASDVSDVSQWVLMGAPVTGSLVGLVLLAPVDAWTIAPLTRWLALAALAVSSMRGVVTFREAISLRGAKQEARTDELTGLVNRRGFTQDAPELLAAALGAPPVPPGSAALLLLDLDGFKDVNDSLGHAAGDQLLTILAARLTASVRSPVDLLARLGGDEFALLLPGTDRAGAQAAAARVHAAMAEPIAVDGIQVHTAGSIGIAMAPEHGSDVSVLLRRADIAMYRAKTESAGFAMYSRDQADADVEERLRRIDKARSALRAGQIEAFYQPTIDLATGAVTGVEALARWRDPERGIVGPDTFLPLLEGAGLMTQLTTTILDQALTDAHRWALAGFDLVVSVNLYPAAVLDETLPARVHALLAEHDVAPDRLQLEITEESLLADRVRARNVLVELRSTGISIAIDDYGSGHSSLACLRELPVDELKLDRVFVLPMTHDPRAVAIVRSTIDLAHALGLRIVAEGVDDAGTAAELTAFGCDAAQGFHYAQAVPADELERWLADRRSTALPSSRPVAESRPA
ncbi:MAG: putative bifunctional diguanylate cyclase/phosphodiesterase [Cellulomonas sp.]